MKKEITVQPDIIVRQAMRKMSQSGVKCLVIIDEKKLLLGTLSDGDVRKAILDGVTIGGSIKKIYNPNPTVLVEGKFKLDEVKQLFVINKFDLIPVVNDSGKLIEILSWETIFENKEKNDEVILDTPVVIMAGGKGSRLEPFTMVLPKPLVPVHEKPVIEHIIERFTNIGVREFIITLNYKARIMKAFFEELSPDYKIDFIEEKKPLGTAGSLKLLEKKFDKPFLVTNCDIIIKADYLALYEFHLKNSYDITLVASMKNYTIPYGTCELNNEGHLKKINEKPEYDFLINTGLYIVNPDLLQLIPRGELYHITHLIKDAKDQGKRVGVYPISDEAWIDVGQWAEYRKALEQF